MKLQLEALAKFQHYSRYDFLQLMKLCYIEGWNKNL